MNDDKSTEARVAILEWRQDQSDASHQALRKEYTEEHSALRKSLQGIEKNLQAIKWIGTGAAAAFVAQSPGASKLLSLILSIL